MKIHLTFDLWNLKISNFFKSKLDYYLIIYKIYDIKCDSYENDISKKLLHV